MDQPPPGGKAPKGGNVKVLVKDNTTRVPSRRSPITVLANPISSKSAEVDSDAWEQERDKLNQMIFELELKNRDLEVRLADERILSTRLLGKTAENSSSIEAENSGK